jgi:hypothetical protein
MENSSGVDRRYAVVMLAAAATFAIASYLHLDGRIPLGLITITGEHFARASIPEAVIGAVLAAGAAAVAAAPRRARAAALGAVGFAALGVLAGLGFVLTSSRPHIAADLAYHLSVLAVLLAGLWALARAGGTGAAPTGSARPSRQDGTGQQADWGTPAGQQESLAAGDRTRRPSGERAAHTDGRVDGRERNL